MGRRGVARPAKREPGPGRERAVGGPGDRRLGVGRRRLPAGVDRVEIAGGAAVRLRTLADRTQRIGLAGMVLLAATNVSPAGSGRPDAVRHASAPVVDYNGDGFGDLTITIPWQDVGGAYQAGAVLVLYGGADGPQATAPDDQIWTEDSPGLPSDPDAEESFGHGL